jgi:uncharacterized membrane protein (UPF0136 family)
MFDLIKKGFAIVFMWREQTEKHQNPLLSKTIWGLVLTWGALLASKYAGINLAPEEQTAILAVVGIFLRMITHRPVGFWEDQS